MSLWRRTSRGYIDEYDLWGAVNALTRRAVEGRGDAALVYTGAVLVLDILCNHDEIRDQSQLVQLVDRWMEDNGLLPGADTDTDEERGTKDEIDH